MEQNPHVNRRHLRRFLSLLVFIVGVAPARSARALGHLAQTPSPAPAEFKFPDTPAGRQLQAWLAAFDSGDRATLQAFAAKNMAANTPPDFADQTLQVRNEVGGFNFQKIEESSEVRLVALARTRTSGEGVRVIIEVEATEPHRIASIQLQPAELGPPEKQLTEAEAATAREQPSFRQFTAWLAAFNSGDREKYRQFLESNFPSRVKSLNEDMNFRARTGGFELRKLEQGSATQLAGLIQERDSDQFARFTLEVETIWPHHIVSLGLMAIARPAGFEIPRLTETQALAAVKALLEKNTATGQFSGAVLVAKSGRVIFSGAYGMADREKKIPNTLDTRFRIGSMNKMFTSVSILQLAEAGKINLGDPVGKYITDYPNQEIATQVTVDQLLTHTGGTGDIFGPEFDAHRKELRTLNDYVALYGKRGPEFEPGTQWRYSNYGMLLLGVVIERVTGQSYYDYVQEHVYRPAGMTLSGSQPEDEPVPGRAVGYMRSEATGAWVPNTGTLPYRGTSAGGGYSTVGDFYRFAYALLGHRLLSVASTDLLITGKVDARGGRYAYGFEDMRDANGNGYVGHGGGAPGMNGALKIYPKSSYVIVVLSNLDPPAAQQISDFLDNRLPR